MCQLHDTQVIMEGKGAYTQNEESIELTDLCMAKKFFMSSSPCHSSKHKLNCFTDKSIFLC